MKQKYYAVRRGNTTGIFLTWDECRDAVSEFPKAEYKSFFSPSEAERYLKNEEAEPDEQSDPMSYAVSDTLVAFVDGSFDVHTKKYGFGCVMIAPDGSVTEKNGFGDNEQAAEARNVAGELLATMTAATFAVKNGYRKLIVYHDYNGIALWYIGKWKAQKFAPKEYILFMSRFKGVLDISFEKVEAHTGVFFNERADVLAKSAIGIES